jgi:hypothetical protein
MANYTADNYKFTSVDVMSSTTIRMTERTTYDLLEAFGDVGGLNEFVKLFMG